LASSSTPSYPSELLWNGRQVDQDFDLDELLYYRVENFDERGKVSAIDSILCPDTSFNRSKYSKPEHVLYAQLPRFLKWKVARIAVRDVPPTLRHPDPKDAREFQFKVVHEPVRRNPPLDPDENYAHCEIQTFHNLERKKRVPGLVAKLYSQTLAELMVPAPLDV